MQGFFGEAILILKEMIESEILDEDEFKGAGFIDNWRGFCIEGPM